MKRVITTASNVILSSDNFELIKSPRVDFDGNEYEGYQVISKGLAEECLVRIELDGNTRYTGCHIHLGMPIRPRDDEDIRALIHVLQSALDFETQVRDYLDI